MTPLRYALVLLLLVVPTTSVDLSTLAALLKGRIKHIIVLMEENRSFGTSSITRTTHTAIPL